MHARPSWLTRLRKEKEPTLMKTEDRAPGRDARRMEWGGGKRRRREAVIWARVLGHFGCMVYRLYAQMHRRMTG